MQIYNFLETILLGHWQAAVSTIRFSWYFGWFSIQELSYFPKQGIGGKRFLYEGLKSFIRITIGH